MATEREAGWEAFQRGDVEDAIRLLRTACQLDPKDYEARLSLGAAYSRAERHADAVSTLTEAVHLQPANAQARYNLGVAMEKAGYVPQALEAFRQAVTLDPDYFKARDAVHRLESAGVADTLPQAVPPATPGAFPTGQPYGGGAQGDSFGPRPAAGFPPGGASINATSGYDTTAQFAAPIPPAAGYISAAPGEPAPGFDAPPRTAPATALPSHGLLADYAPSPHAPAGVSSVLQPYAPGMPPPNYNDEMNIPGAFRDFGQILVAPNRFFSNQVGRNGLMSPILIVGIYLLLQFVTILVNNGAAGAFGFVMGLVLSPISIAIAGAWMVFGYLISALIVHFIGWLFGNRQDYSVSFRACVFADVPRFAISFVLGLVWALAVMPAYLANPITPKEIEQAIGLPAGTMTGTYNTTGSSFPTGATPGGRANRGVPSVTRATAPMPQPSIGMVQRAFGLAWRRFGTLWIVWIGLNVIGWAWSTVLLILAIHRLQQISLGAAIGVVAMMYAIGLLIVALIILGFAGLIFAIINSAMHSGAAAGGVGH